MHKPNEIRTIGRRCTKSKTRKRTFPVQRSLSSRKASTIVTPVAMTRPRRTETRTMRAAPIVKKGRSNGGCTWTTIHPSTSAAGRRHATTTISSRATAPQRWQKVVLWHSPRKRAADLRRPEPAGGQTAGGTSAPTLGAAASSSTTRAIAATAGAAAEVAGADEAATEADEAAAATANTDASTRRRTATCRRSTAPALTRSW